MWEKKSTGWQCNMKQNDFNIKESFTIYDHIPLTKG